MQKTSHLIYKIENHMICVQPKMSKVARLRSSFEILIHEKLIFVKENDKIL